MTLSTSMIIANSFIYIYTYICIVYKYKYIHIYLVPGNCLNSLMILFISHNNPIRKALLKFHLIKRKCSDFQKVTYLKSGWSCCKC